MLYLVLVLVVAAFGLLVAALVTSTMWWAWASVAASIAGALLLIVDWWRRRARARHAEDQALTAPVGAEPAESGDTATEHSVLASAGEASTVAAGGTATAVADSDEMDEFDPEAEPPEEDTDAADVLAVAELDAEVRVVDERPRYHLAGCAWLGGRPTLPLAVREARELGFTPCAVCSPDRVLAAHQRRGR